MYNLHPDKLLGVATAVGRSRITPPQGPTLVHRLAQSAIDDHRKALADQAAEQLATLQHGHPNTGPAAQQLTTTASQLAALNAQHAAALNAQHAAALNAQHAAAQLQQVYAASQTPSSVPPLGRF